MTSTAVRLSTQHHVDEDPDRRAELSCVNWPHAGRRTLPRGGVVPRPFSCRASGSLPTPDIGPGVYDRLPGVRRRDRQAGLMCQVALRQRLLWRRGDG